MVWFSVKQLTSVTNLKKSEDLKYFDWVVNLFIIDFCYCLWVAWHLLLAYLLKIKLALYIKFAIVFMLIFIYELLFFLWLLFVYTTYKLVLLNYFGGLRRRFSWCKIISLFCFVSFLVIHWLETFIFIFFWFLAFFQICDLKDWIVDFEVWRRKFALVTPSLFLRLWSLLLYYEKLNVGIVTLSTYIM